MRLFILVKVEVEVKVEGEGIGALESVEFNNDVKFRIISYRYGSAG